MQGYLDPEYFYNNMLTEKSDVYSLGIVFLELLTGMPPISRGKNIVREVIFIFQKAFLTCKRTLVYLVHRLSGSPHSFNIKTSFTTIGMSSMKI